MGFECKSATRSGVRPNRAATSSRSGPSYTTGIRCRRPGSSIGGRFAASLLMAAVSASCVVWSGSKCTVTVAYPATVWRTSRRFFNAVASAMALVFRAVSRRVPSSARSAVSPSGYVRTRGAGRRVERGGGMCAHKNGVDGARQEADANEPDASHGNHPRRHHRRCGEVPGRKVALHLADRLRKVEQLNWSARPREATRAMGHEKQQEKAPRQGDHEQRCDVRVSTRKRDQVRERVHRERADREPRRPRATKWPRKRLRDEPHP